MDDRGSGPVGSMSDEVRTESALSRRDCPTLAHRSTAWSIGSLEEALLRVFPTSDALDWDRNGLIVGERAVPLRKAAVALDPTVSAIRKAAEAGANVLITHHPPFLTAPDSFAPERSAALSSGAVVWAAIQHGVALMCFHTALDVSPQAAHVLPRMLGLEATGSFVDPAPSAPNRGFGHLCRVGDRLPLSLAKLAARCTAVFGRQPRVWGDMTGEVGSVVTATGSLGSVGRAALLVGADCVVCGEVKYHDALDLSEAGLSVIELGHDVSELPLVALLARTMFEAGVAENLIVAIDQSSNWQYPEAVRL